MSERSKNKFLRGYNIILLLLAAVFTVVSFLPIVVIDANRTEYPEIFLEGRFTADMLATDKVELGYGTLFSLVANWNDFITVVTIQSNEGYVKNESKLLEELREENASEERINDLLEEIAEAREKLDEDLAELTDEDYERIADKLENNDGFRNIVCAVYSFAGSAADEDADEAGDSLVSADGGYGVNPVPILVGILTVFLTVSLILMALTYPLVLFVKFVTQLIFFFRSLKEDPSVSEKYMEKFPASRYCATAIALFALYSMFAPEGLSVGISVIGCLVLWLVCNLLRAVKHVLLNESNKPLAWAKQGVSCISIIAAILLLVNFSGLSLIGELEDSIDTIAYKHYMAEMEELAEENMDSGERGEAAKRAVSLSNGINTGVVVLVTVPGILLITVALINAAERLGYQSAKPRTGGRAPHKAMRSLAITILAFILLPTVLFTANSAEALEDAYAAGNFKVWYDAYQEEGTPENLEYEVLLGTREATEQYVESLEDDGSEAELEEAKALLASIEDRIDEIESKGSKGILCIVLALILVAAEFVYHFLPKFFPAGKKKEPAAEVGASEETFEPASAGPVPAETRIRG